MLVAQGTAGQLVEASRDLEVQEFTCPACRGPVLLKRGRVKVAHFAHLPSAECSAEGESVSHLRAKEVLARRFRQLGYSVQLEEAHPRHGRRIDVAVTIPTARRPHRVAVEVQDSAISVQEMKARMRIDQALGFLGTVWVFTDKRAKVLLEVTEVEVEVRVPTELRWIDSRYKQGIFVLDMEAEAMWSLRLFSATRVHDSEWWGVSFSTPKTLKYISKYPAGFTLTCRPGRFKEWAVVFVPSP